MTNMSVLERIKVDQAKGNIYQWKVGSKNKYARVNMNILKITQQQQLFMGKKKELNATLGRYEWKTKQTLSIYNNS